MKKIIIIWDSIEIGGVDTYLYNLLISKKFQNKSITILTNHNNNAKRYLGKKLKNFKGINILDYYSFFSVSYSSFPLRVVYFFLKPILFLFSIYNFISIFRKKSYDVIIGQCGNYGNLRSEQAALIAASIIKIPKKILVVHHECNKPTVFMGFINNLVNFYLNKILNEIVTVSYASKKSLLKKSKFLTKKKKIKVIHNGIVVKKIKRKNYLNRFFKKEKNYISVCMLSRINSYKGQENLIKMLAYQKKIFEKFNFFFIGSGDRKYVNKLKVFCKSKNINNIKFLGFIDISSRKILSSFDLFLSLTTDYEGFGLSIAESMSVKTPIIATRVGAVTEVIDNKTGLLISPNNNSQLILSLKKFTSHRKTFENKTSLALKKVTKKFNNDLMAKKYMKLIKS